LASGPDQRHKYQIDVVSAVSELCVDLKKDRAGLVREAEAEVAKAVTEKQRLDTQLTELVATELVKREAKTAASAALELAQKTEQDTKVSLENAQKEIADTERQIAMKTAAKTKFEATFSDSWPALRDGTFSPKDWRARNKVVGVLVPMLTSAPESLRSGLAQALKEKPESRGRFAQKTIEYAENAFQEHIAEMTREITSLDSAVEGARALIAQTEVQLQADTSRKDSAWEASIVAENAWVEADSEVFNVKGQIKSFERSQAARLREVDNQKALQKRVNELVANFESLRDDTTTSKTTAGAVGGGAEPVEMVQADDAKMAA